MQTGTPREIADGFLPCDTCKIADSWYGLQWSYQSHTSFAWLNMFFIDEEGLSKLTPGDACWESSAKLSFLGSYQLIFSFEKLYIHLV